jgi:hypothetical protein
MTVSKWFCCLIGAGGVVDAGATAGEGEAPAFPLEPPWFRSSHPVIKSNAKVVKREVESADSPRTPLLKERLAAAWNAAFKKSVLFTLIDPRRGRNHRSDLRIRAINQGLSSKPWAKLGSGKSWKIPELRGFL